MLNRVLVLTALVVLFSTAATARADDAPAARFDDLDRWSVPEPRDAGSLLGQRLDLGLVDLGVHVGPRHRLLGSPSDGISSAAARYRLGVTELSAPTDVGVDLRLRWPSWAAPREPVLSGLQPYLSLGPALSPGHELLPVGNATTPRRDESMSLGVRGGVGVTWQLAPDTSLFGEYRLTQERPLTGRDGGQRGVDLLYGVSVRF